MIRLRPNQIENLGKSNFLARIAAFLCEQFSEAKDVPLDEMKAVVKRQITNAAQYGLATEQQVASYVITAWLLGENFDTEFGAAQEVLPSETLTAEEKAQWLVEWTDALFAALEK